jgi:hypothetical protein
MFYQLVDEIWAGPYPNKKMIEQLVERGVCTFVNLTRWDEKIVYWIRSYKRHLPDRVGHLNFPLWTYSLPSLDAMLAIASTVENNSPSYLHCRHGIDRTGVTAVLILMKKGLTLPDAIEHIARAREGLPHRSPRKDYHFGYLADAAAKLGRK